MGTVRKYVIPKTLEELLSYALPKTNYGFYHSRGLSKADNIVPYTSRARRGRITTRGNSRKCNKKQFITDWPKATDSDFAIVIMAASFLFNSDTYDNTATFLLNSLGAWDNGNYYDGDSLFIFEMSVFPRQIEFYVNSSGKITEIACYDQKKKYDISIPVNFDGLVYALCQVFVNFKQVNFSEQISKDTYEQNQIKIAKSLGELSNYNLIKKFPFDKICKDVPIENKIIIKWQKILNKLNTSESKFPKIHDIIFQSSSNKIDAETGADLNNQPLTNVVYISYGKIPVVSILIFFTIATGLYFIAQNLPDKNNNIADNTADNAIEKVSDSPKYANIVDTSFVKSVDGIYLQVKKINDNYSTGKGKYFNNLKYLEENTYYLTNEQLENYLNLIYEDLNLNEKDRRLLNDKTFDFIYAGNSIIDSLILNQTSKIKFNFYMLKSIIDELHAFSTYAKSINAKNIGCKNSVCDENDIYKSINMVKRQLEKINYLCRQNKKCKSELKKFDQSWINYSLILYEIVMNKTIKQNQNSNETILVYISYQQLSRLIKLLDYLS